jgi:hypothetical protein
MKLEASMVQICEEKNITKGKIRWKLDGKLDGKSKKKKHLLFSGHELRHVSTRILMFKDPEFKFSRYQKFLKNVVFFAI